jgi:hypothetical protein
MTSFNQIYAREVEVWVDPPATETSVGVPGQKSSDGVYKYECYAVNRWLRFLTSGWSTEVPPSNSVAPAISGTIDIGETITCSTGSWTGGPTGYAYAWFVDGVLDAGLGTANSIVIPHTLSLTTVKCRVTATNAYGSTTAYSNEVEVPLSAPVNTVSPTLSGLAEIGETLTCGTGTWAHTPTSYAYAWFVDGVEDGGLGTANTLVVPEELGGTAVTCQVTATNATGSAAAMSNAKNIGSGYTPGLDFSEPQNSMYLPILAF